jgi:hypothetical protein
LLRPAPGRQANPYLGTQHSVVVPGDTQGYEGHKGGRRTKAVSDSFVDTTAEKDKRGNFDLLFNGVITFIRWAVAHRNITPPFPPGLNKRLVYYAYCVGGTAATTTHAVDESFPWRLQFTYFPSIIFRLWKDLSLALLMARETAREQSDRERERGR